MLLCFIYNYHQDWLQIYSYSAEYSCYCLLNYCLLLLLPSDVVQRLLPPLRSLFQLFFPLFSHVNSFLALLRRQNTLTFCFFCFCVWDTHLLWLHFDDDLLKFLVRRRCIVAQKCKDKNKLCMCVGLKISIHYQLKPKTISKCALNKLKILHLLIEHIILQKL